MSGDAVDGDRAAALAARVRRLGWAVVPAEPALNAWVDIVAAPLCALSDADADRRCGGTWSPGVNLAPTRADGAWPEMGAPPLSGLAIRAARILAAAPDLALDRAQISTVRPGYPVQEAGESVAAHRYRRERAAAHLDGLTRGRDGARHLTERHGFLLGVALDDAGASEGASPLVIWERSQDVMREMLAAALSGVSDTPDAVAAVDVSRPYQAARRRVFEAAARRSAPLRRGEAVLVHRLCLHGVAPWTAPFSALGAAGPTRRSIAYFRPDPRPTAQPSWFWRTP